MNVEYINPFIEASQSVLKFVANLDTKLGKVTLKKSPYPSDSIAIFIGLTGQIRGQVVISMGQKVACRIASAMMGGYPVPALDEMSRSAIAELSNIILGNTATIFSGKGIPIEITPPSLVMGDNFQISSEKMQAISIPIHLDDGECIELVISFAND